MKTDDALLRAKAMLNRAAANGKPITVFLGFRSVHGERRLVAVDDSCDVVKSLPHARITVAPGDDAATLARIITEHWAALDTQLSAVPAKSTTKPVRGHKWRNGWFFPKRVQA